MPLSPLNAPCMCVSCNILATTERSARRAIPRDLLRTPLAQSPATRRPLRRLPSGSNSFHLFIRGFPCAGASKRIRAHIGRVAHQQRKPTKRGIAMLGDSSRLRMLIAKPALARSRSLAVHRTGRAPGRWRKRPRLTRASTIRTIGEALPPLEAMKKLAPEFEKRPASRSRSRCTSTRRPSTR